MEVIARRLNSPLDSLIKMKDSKGNVLAWNDDFMRQNIGIKTHHADSYLTMTVPENGRYTAEISDTRGHGGSEFFYYLRLDHPQPDFQVYSFPSSFSMTVGQTQPVTLVAERIDGYSGDIQVQLADSAQPFTLSGATIPAGKDRIIIGLTSLTKARGNQKVHALNFQAEAIDEGIIRPVIPCDEQMQAFIYLHLLPTDHLYVQMKRWGAKNLRTDVDSQLQVTPGSSFQITLQASAKQGDIPEFDILSPVNSFVVTDVQSSGDRIVLELKVSDQLEAGTRDNLIVHAAVTRSMKRKGKTKERRVSLGILPAMPFIVPSAN